MTRLTVPLVLLVASPALANDVALTLRGQPVPLAPDVYRLAVPVVAPRQVDPAEAGPPPLSKPRRILIGTAIGAAIGCAVLTSLNSSYGDSGENGGFCLIGVGIGAVPAVLVAVANHRADP